MSTYNHTFTPGNKSNLRRFIAQSYLQQYYGTTKNIDIDKCANANANICIAPQVNLLQQAYNDSSRTKNARISQILTGRLGGKTTYGNFNQPAVLNYMGGINGQPGGTITPPRNTF